MTQLAIIADLDRCIGCHSCVVACKQERQVPLGLSFIRVAQVGPEGEFPDLNMYYVPVICQQCRRPSCAASCPEDAIRRAENGVVTVISEQCTGCGECVAGCPYGAIVLDSGQNLARKCDLCPQLLSTDHLPACVAACPAKALAVVDMDRDSSAVTGQRPQQHGRTSFSLTPSLGTDPAARFILARQEWRDMPWPTKRGL
jgi:Fe-S-cluster-containing dehydrogenase component